MPILALYILPQHFGTHSYGVRKVIKNSCPNQFTSGACMMYML